MTDKPEPIAQQGNKEILIARPDPTFKEITGSLAQAIGIKIRSAELPQSLYADFILEVPPEVNLDNTLFSFMANYQYAVVDFKGQNDPLDMTKLHNNVARTALFCAKNPQVDVRQVLNLLVCSRYPQEILRHEKGVTGFKRPDAKGQPWLWLGKYAIQEVGIVVCRDLPIEPRFYEWLIFVPSDNKRWPETVQTFYDEKRYDLLATVLKMHPRGVKDMELKLDWDKIYREMDPIEKARLDAEWAEVIPDKLSEFATSNPEILDRLIAKFGQSLTPEQRAKLSRVLAGGDKVEQLTNTLTEEQLEEILRRRRADSQQPDTDN